MDEEVSITERINKIPRLKFLLYLLVILMLILVVFNIRLEYLKHTFKRDCKVTYNINDSCPCYSPKQDNYGNISNNLNFQVENT